MTVHTATSTNSIINQKSISASVLGNLVVSTISLFTSTRSSDQLGSTDSNLTIELRTTHSYDHDVENKYVVIIPNEQAWCSD